MPHSLLDDTTDSDEVVANLADQLADISFGSTLAPESPDASPAALLPVREQKIKSRLFVGEADFSFSCAFADRHPNLEVLSQVVATEYLSSAELSDIYQEKFEANINALNDRGIKVYLKVDGRSLHRYSIFARRRFHSIHFNFPHDKSNFKDRTLPKLLVDFFFSARQLQKPSDRIYMALPRQTDVNYRRFYEAYVYNIFEAAANAGYNLVEVKPFDNERYPGYEHAVTGQSRSADVAQNAAEYIFEFTGLSEKYITELRNPTRKEAYDETHPVLPRMAITPVVDETEDETYMDLPVLRHWCA